MKFSRDNRARLQASDFTVLVTGATGWLGQAALEMLFDAYGEKFSHRVRAFAGSTHTIRLRGGHQVDCRPLPEISGLASGDYLFFHFAFLGKERTTEFALPDYAARVQEITELMTGIMRRVGTRGIFLPSSGAVYRPDHSQDDDMERNPYGVLKLRDEKIFAQVAAELDVPITVARIFNMSGPYINKLGSYALASIVMDVLRREPIRLQAAHPVIRSYVHVGDILDVSLSCQFEHAALTFDTVGETEIELGELARTVAAVLGRPDHPVMRPPLMAEPVNRYVGDPGQFRHILNRLGYSLSSLDRQIADTADFLKGTLPAG